MPAQDLKVDLSGQSTKELILVGLVANYPPDSAMWFMAFLARAELMRRPVG